MKKLLAAALCLLALSCLCTGALADSRWVHSQMNGDIRLAMYDDYYYDTWSSADGTGGVTIPESTDVTIISRNASVWGQPRTNSQKLGSAKNGERLSANIDGNGRIIEQDGFFSVRYNGRNGWVNSAYAVSGALEITLMEGNVPAYCAPDRYSKRVGSLNKLTSYTVLGFYEDFYVISLREAAAFVPMSVRHYDSTFCRYYHGSAHMGNATTISNTTMRTGPGDNYASVRDVKAGRSFVCLDVIDGWCLTVDDDSDCYAYIYSGDVTGL